MNSRQWHFLLSAAGQRRLAETAALPLTDANHLQVAARLRQEIEPQLAQAVIETTLLRQRARAKFSRADEMYFTRPALEQSSSEVISSYRARRFLAGGFALIGDLGCGIGGDALALAAVAQTVGLDQDWQRLAMARENVRAYGRSEQFEVVQTDLREQPPLAVEALFFDPARRRKDGRRLKSVHLYRPPLSLVQRWREQTPHAAVKISPGVDYAELPEEAEAEFISLSGDLKECVLWYGDLRRAADRRATLLPDGDTLSSADYPGSFIVPQEPRAYLYEPDSAVIRAHLVQPLARLLNAAPVDETIAYLTADAALETPFARRFALEDWFPFQLKRLRTYLRERGIGRVTIKKRGSPLDTADLERKLRLQGDEERIIFLTHVLGQPAVLIGRQA